MKKIKFILSLTFAFCCMFGSVYANTEIDLTEINESQIEEIEERVIVVPVTKDYVGQGYIVQNDIVVGKFSIHANITYYPESGDVTVNSFRGQIDKKTAGMIKDPEEIVENKIVSNIQSGDLAGKRLIYSVTWNNDFGNPRTDTVELVVFSDGSSYVITE